ncbi:MAG TPA: cell division protein FtsQ/DivIB [Gammaproteobacteria bacterium]|nr:cell division protein FtsQ/DivIB [Gammaproteobacteria bacterium]
MSLTIDLRPERRNAERRRPLWRAVLAGALVLAVIAVGWGAWRGVTQSRWLRLETLVVSGRLAHTPPETIRDVVLPYVQSGFLGVDLEAVRRSVEALAWIAEARVRREWPGTLRVEVVEETPVATWFGTALLNARGEVFVDGAAQYARELPDLGGPAGSQRLLLEQYSAMSGIVAGTGLRLKRVALSERRAWELWLENGVQVRLGRQDAERRLERFARHAVPLLLPQMEHVAYVDMRYTNGFTVGWRAGAPVSGGAGA